MHVSSFRKKDAGGWLWDERSWSGRLSTLDDGSLRFEAEQVFKVSDDPDSSAIWTETKDDMRLVIQEPRIRPSAHLLGVIIKSNDGGVFHATGALRDVWRFIWSTWTAPNAGGA